MSNERTLKEIFGQIIRNHGATHQLKAAQIKANWQKIVWRIIAIHTTKLQLKDTTLYIEVDSAPIRNELYMQREHLCQLINQELGENYVEKIVLN